LGFEFVSVCGRAGGVLFFLSLIEMWGARIAQSVYRLATGWMAKVPEFKFQYRQDFSPIHVIQTSTEACPALTNGYQGLFPPGVKWLVHEADHSPPTNAEVKNT
jgi:hypothetical protein